jgi:CheY-like chemotaxis protein
MADSRFRFNRVLLVEDSEIDILVNRRLMELTSFAAHVIVAGSAEEALDFLRNECVSPKDAPDWIFLDLHLPMMNGYDFVEEFKTLPGFITEKSRIIIFSVLPKQDHLKKVFENKFVAGCIEKPLTHQTLKEIAEGKLMSFSASA